MSPRSFQVYVSDTAYVTFGNGAFAESTNAGFTGSFYVVLPAHTFGAPNEPYIEFTFWWDGLQGSTTPMFPPMFRYANWGTIFNSSGFTHYLNGVGLGGGHFDTSGSSPGYSNPNRFKVWGWNSGVVNYPPTGGSGNGSTNHSYPSSGFGVSYVAGWNTWRISKFDGLYDSHIDWFMSNGNLSAHVTNSSNNATGSPNSFSLFQTYENTVEAGATEWLWDFDDGSPTSTDEFPDDHIYYNPGTYNVTCVANIGHLGAQVFSLVVVITGDPIDPNPPPPDPDPTPLTWFSWSQITQSSDAVAYHMSTGGYSRYGSEIEGGFLSGDSSGSFLMDSVHVPRQVGNAIRLMTDCNFTDAGALRVQIVTPTLSINSALFNLTLYDPVLGNGVALEWIIPTFTTVTGFWVCLWLDVSTPPLEPFNASVYNQLCSCLNLPSNLMPTANALGNWRIL